MRIFLFIILTVAMAFGAGVIPQKLIDARDAERSSQWDKAIQTYKEILKIDFTSKEAWQGIFRSQASKEITKIDSKLPVSQQYRLKGSIYLRYFQYPAAIDLFSKALAINPNSSEDFMNLVGAYLQAGFRGRALKLLEDEVSRHKQNKQFLLKVADFCYARSLYKQGAEFYRQALDKGLKADSVYIRYARCLENTGQVDQAEKALQEGLRKNHNSDFYSAFIQFYIRQANFDKALALAKDSKDEFNVVKVYLKLKGRKAVIDYFLKKIQKDPYNLPYYVWVSQLYSMEKEYKKARDIVQRGLKRYPENEQLWEMLSDLQAKLGDYKDAAGIIKYRLSKNDINRKRTARILILEKNFSKAKPIIDDLIARKKLTLLELAEWYQDAYPYKAEEIYQKALAENPDDYKVLTGYFKLLRKLRKFEQASLLVEKELQKHPEWLEYDGVNILKFLCLNGKGDVALKTAHNFILSNDTWQRITQPNIYQPYLVTLQLTGSTREYFIFLELLLELRPDSKQLYNKIARLYEQNGNYKEALYYYKLLMIDQPMNAERRYKVATMYAKLDNVPAGLKILRQGPVSQKMRPVDLYYLARYYYDLGHFEQALVTIRPIAGQRISEEASFRDPYGFVLKTLIYEAAGKLQDAQKALQQYVELFPNEPQAHQLLAEYLFRHGQFDKAEQEYKTLFRLTPSDLTTLRRIALCMVYQNKVGEATQFLESQIKKSKFIPDEEIDYYKGYLAHIMNNYQEALKYYDQALRKNPQNSHLLFLHGLLMEEMNDYDQALADYKKAMEEDSTYARYDKFGDIYREMHKYNEALRYYALYRNFMPEDISVFVSIGECYKNMDRDDDIYALIGALQSFPESANRSYQEGRLYEQLENYTMAERNYLHSVLLRSGVTPALRSLAQLYIKMGNFLEAEVWTRKYYEAAPQNPYNMDLMGVYYMESRDFVSAEYWFQKITQTIPWYYYAQNNLGLVYLNTGRFTQAYDIFRSVSKAHPEQALFRRNWAQAAIRLNKFKEAQKIYQDLLTDQPYNLNNYIDYARFQLLIKNQPKSARKTIKQAMKLAAQNKDVQAFDNLLLAYEHKPKLAISRLLDLQTYYNDNNRYAQGTLAMYLALAYEKKKDIKTRNQYLAIAQKMYPNSFWIQEAYKKRDVGLKVVTISEKPEVIAAQQKQGLMDTFQKYEDRFTSLELNNRYKLSQVISEKIAEKANKQAEYDVSLAPDRAQKNLSLKLVQAPKIKITAPKDGHHTRASSITVEGFITRNKKPVSIDLNGKPIDKIGRNIKIQKMPDPKLYPGALPFKVDDFPLVPGANFLTVHARFKDGYETKSTVRVGRIAKLLYAFETTPRLKRGVNRWALVVAVGDYEDPSIPDVSNASANVRAVEKMLTSPKGLGIPKSNVLVLALNTGILPTYSAILDGIRTIARYVEPQDEVIVYFAGNGVIQNEKEIKNPQNLYLLTQDSQINNLPGTAINFELLYQTLKTVPAKMVSCFIDANFYKPNLKGLSSFGRNFSNTISFWNEDQAPQVNILSLCNGLKKTSGRAPSSFTKLLVKALMGSADKNKDQKITIGEIYDYLSKRKKSKECIFGDFKQKAILFSYLGS